MQELKYSKTAHFVTLTYDEKHVPRTENGFKTLKKSDFQDYMKRLRKLFPNETLKYYAVGEYGTKRKRPHYHAIIFNCTDPASIETAWVLNDELIGDVQIGDVNTDSIAYCMKYIDKKNSGANAVLLGRMDKKFARDDRIPEFSLMSKGLGQQYLTDNIKNYHRAVNDRLYVTKTSGHKVSMPRYYRNKIWTEQERKDQQGVIQFFVDKAEEKERQQVAQQFGDRLTFEQYKASQKKQIHNDFYTKLKKRKI